MVPPRRPRPAAAAGRNAAAPALHNPLSWPGTREGLRLRGRDEHDGLVLGDEVLLLIVSLVSDDTADLVRCAATCRRWRRLVSADAAFICRRADPRSRRFVRRFALGFYKVERSPSSFATAATAPRRGVVFVPLPSAAPPTRLCLCGPGGGGPMVRELVDGDGKKILEDASSRVVASRDGRIVVEVGRSKHGRVLKLCVCNPFTAEVDVLPRLRGDAFPGRYACALLTADYDEYRLILIYNRRGFTAARCYSSSSSTGRWGPEARVTGARMGRMMRAAHTAAIVLHRGVVFWPRLKLALLTLPPTTAETNGDVVVQGMRTPDMFGFEKNLLGLMPDGRLCWVEALPADDRIRVFFFHSYGGDVFSSANNGTFRFNECWSLQRTITLHQKPVITPVKLRWFCEKSGVVLFTAASRRGQCGIVEDCYALDLDTTVVRKVAGGEPTEMDDDDSMYYGYEMDRVSFLASLGEKSQDMESAI